MSIIEQARAELDRANFDKEESKALLIILMIFFDTWDSGGAVSAMQPVLTRLISGQPLSPLTGADDEWFDPMGDGALWQNVRAGSVFREKDASGQWFAYDIDRDPRDGEIFERLPSGRHRCAISFPYDPITKHVPEPVMVVDTGTAAG